MIDGFQMGFQYPGYATETYCIYLWNKSKREVWVHEVIHMTDIIFSSLDGHALPLLSSTEVRAYIGGWLFSEIERLSLYLKINKSTKEKP